MNTTYAFELNTRPGRDGLYTVLLRITLNRKKRRLKTPVIVKKDEFNPKAKWGYWIVKRSDKAALNDELENFHLQARSQLKDLEKSGPVSGVAVLKQHLRTPPESLTLHHFTQSFLARMKAGWSVNYERHITSKLETFCAFVGPTLLLREVSLDILNRFKTHLQKKRVSTSTQHYYFSRILRLINDARRSELIDKDPFLNFEMPPDRPKPRLKLSDEQISSFRQVPTQAGKGDGLWQHRAKWLYLFSFQKAGVRHADMLQLRVGNLRDGRLQYQMDKTGKLITLKLTEADSAIIRHFYDPAVKARPAHSYLFGVLDDETPYARYVTWEEKKKMPRELAEKLFADMGSAQTQINKALKKIAARAGIEEELTFHTARHTFADRARRRMKESKNISVDDIRSALGHTRLDTTQRYLTSFDKEALDDAMDAVFGE